MNSNQKREQWKLIRDKLLEYRNKAILEFYSFADSLTAISNISSLTFTGKSTNISKALDEINLDKADNLILISDGRHNGPGGPVSEDLVVPLWVVPVGERKILNLAIKEAFLENQDMATGELKPRVKVRIRSSAAEPQALGLRVESDDGTGLTRKVSLPADCLTEVSLELPSVKTKVWKLWLDTLPGEDQIDDNSLTIPAEPVDKKYDVLFVASTISAETEIILQSLRLLPKITLYTWIEISPGIIKGDRIQSPDVIILGPVTGNISPSITDFISARIRNGTPTLFLETGFEIPESLARFSPLVYDGRKVISDSIPYWTPTGEILTARWDLGILPTSTPIDVYSARPGESQILAGSSDATLIAVHSIPSRVVGIQLPDFHATAREDHTGLVYFLKTIISYLVQGESFPFRITVTNTAETSIELNLYSTIDVAPDELDAWLEPDSNSLQLHPLSNTSFLLTGTAPNGRYDLNVSWNGVEKNLGTIDVKPAEPESPSRGMNTVLLKLLADREEGKLVPVDDLAELLDAIPLTKGINYKPLKNPWAVLVIGVLFLTDIWYRRKNGLP